MAISLTPASADRIQKFLATRGHGLGLKLGVRKTGCSGFAYVVNYADEAAPQDVVFEDQGVKVYVDPESLKFIDGTTVDFVSGVTGTGVAETTYPVMAGIKWQKSFFAQLATPLEVRDLANAMLLFVLILLVGLGYAWRKGVLTWK